MGTRLGPTLTGPDNLLTEIQARRICTGMNRNANDRHEKCSHYDKICFSNADRLRPLPLTGIGIAIQKLAFSTCTCCMVLNIAQAHQCTCNRRESDNHDCTCMAMTNTHYRATSPTLTIGLERNPRCSQWLCAPNPFTKQRGAFP